MNLGGLTTLARYRPRNLVHVVFDNESLLSVGGFPTATSTGSDIAGMAAARVCRGPRRSRRSTSSSPRSTRRSPPRV
jgi:sulfopyruvate decarboxylase subunit beta